MPTKSIELFADTLAQELRIMGFNYAERGFEKDPLGGRFRTLARWKVMPARGVDICVYADSYFGGSYNCWVGFGSRQQAFVDPIKLKSYVVLHPEDWAVEWDVVDNAKKEALKRTSFTVYEDWRSRRGWVWFGRYFKDDQTDKAIAFVREVIYRPRLRDHSSGAGRKTEGAAETKVRFGQAEFRDAVIELWGRKCALTGCRVVPALEAAHIDSWAQNKEERLSTENGLPLLRTVHKLFEDGLLSFADDRRLLSKLSRDDLASLGLRESMRLSRPLTRRQKSWMKVHRRKYGFKDVA